VIIASVLISVFNDRARWVSICKSSADSDNDDDDAGAEMLTRLG
jgi:hypothetical protein